jgi:hypothetical protein
VVRVRMNQSRGSWQGTFHLGRHLIIILVITNRQSLLVSLSETRVRWDSFAILAMPKIDYLTIQGIVGMRVILGSLVDGWL